MKATLVIMIVVLTSAVQALAAGPSVDEIVAKTNHVAYYQGRSGRARVWMTIKDAQGRERTREFTILRLNLEPKGRADDSFAGDQDFYVYFERPADVNKTAYLVHKHVGKEDDRWLFLPGLNLVKRIAASDKRTSFVGSDFCYEDVSGRSTSADRHELVETTDLYYVLKNIPKDPKSVEFAYYKMWIHKATFIPVQVVYYDASGEKIREAQALEVKEIQGFPTVTKSVMRDLRTGSATTIQYSKVEYNIDLTKDIFTERYLRNPPRRYLR